MTQTQRSPPTDAGAATVQQELLLLWQARHSITIYTAHLVNAIDKQAVTILKPQIIAIDGVPHIEVFLNLLA